MTEQEILEQIKISYSSILGENLVGIYVHGSIAFGCFRWEQSDIDFIAVVDRPLTLPEKEALIRVILELDPHCPLKGIEMSVVLVSACGGVRARGGGPRSAESEQDSECRAISTVTYPTPYELHYSNAHKARYQADLPGYCNTLQGVDPDLAAHFTVINACGIVLTGPPVEEVFGQVAPEDYLDSIRGDIAGAEEDILENPVYIILNLCRVLAYLREGKVLSKAQGGAWGCANLPEEYREAAAWAWEVYTNDSGYVPGNGEQGADNMEQKSGTGERKADGMEQKSSHDGQHVCSTADASIKLQNFARYMLQQILPPAFA